MGKNKFPNREAMISWMKSPSNRAKEKIRENGLCECDSRGYRKFVYEDGKKKIAECTSCRGYFLYKAP